MLPQRKNTATFKTVYLLEGEKSLGGNEKKAEQGLWRNLRELPPIEKV